MLKEAKANIGLSLGYGYIVEKVFPIPRLGMSNLHSEVSPAFKDASSVNWPIHENVTETGFTSHQGNRTIDHWDILRVEKWPIFFGRSLEQTVRKNLDMGRERAPQTIATAGRQYDDLRSRAVQQKGGQSFTTPTVWQCVRMMRNHARMRTAAARQAA